MKLEPFTYSSSGSPRVMPGIVQDYSVLESAESRASPMPGMDSSNPSGLTDIHDATLTDVLPKYLFLQQLQRDKRRADRSKSPVSVALFQLQDGSGDQLANIDALLDVVNECKRETDLIGTMGGGLIATLLADTNAEGAQRFLRKIADRAEHLPFSRTIATYPDHLFEYLLKEYRPPNAPHPLLLDELAGHHGFGKFLKRAMDFAGAVVAIISLSPLMLMAAVAIAATSPGRIIYKQVRLGRGGIPFVFYKFRTMYSNADDRIHREYVASLIRNGEGNDSPVRLWSKLTDDPRITPLGRILRKTSIDELPQFFNVLRGDLSLVGPRPAIPYETENYQSWQLRRIFAVKPGISGLWQVNSRGQSTFDDMVRLDLRYIRKWRPQLDLKILVATVKVVLRRTGAS